MSAAGLDKERVFGHDDDVPPSAASRPDRQEEDWGGCRCQALRLTGDAAATDPVCRFSPHRRTVVAARKATQADEFTYRTTRRPARV